MDARRLSYARRTQRTRRPVAISGCFGDDSTPAAAIEALAIVDKQFSIAVGQAALDSIIGGVVDYATLASMSNNTQQAVLKNLADMTTGLYNLHTKYLAWAINGHRDDGSAYTWSMWFDYAKTLADAASYQAGVSYDSSNFVAIKDSLRSTADQIATPSDWPWWVYAGGAVIGAVGVSYVVRTFK